MAKILVQGCGDVGSAVAHVLFRAGHCVVLHDSPRPRVIAEGVLKAVEGAGA